MVQANDFCGSRLEHFCCLCVVLSFILPGYESDFQLCLCHFWVDYLVCYSLLVVYARRGVVEKQENRRCY